MSEMHADDLGDLDPAAIVKDEIRQLIEAGRSLSNRQAAQFALLAEVSPRTIRRWAAQVVTDEQVLNGHLLERLQLSGAAGFVFDDVALGLYYLCGGNMRRFRNELIAAGFDVPSEPTLSRKLRREVPRLVRDGARTGHRNRHSAALHIRHTAAASNDVFEVDEFTLDVEVADGGQVIRPRLLLLIDDRSRFIVAWALLRRPATGNDVLALFGDAFEVRPADDGSGRMIGGVPTEMTSDQGSAFRAGPVEVAFASIPTNYRPAPGYTPTAKGKIERAGQHVQAEVVTGIAGRTTKLERRDGTDLMQTGHETLLTFTQALARVSEVIYKLNYETPHGSLNNRTRIEAYDDGVEPKTASDLALASMYLVHPRAEGSRKIHPDGIHADSRYFIAECLHPHIGLEATVRVLHHRRAHVAVFIGARFIGLAYDATELSETDRRAIVAGRRNDNRAVNRHARNARAASRQVNRDIAGGGRGSAVEAYIDAGLVADAEADEAPAARRVAPTGLNAARRLSDVQPVAEQPDPINGVDVLRRAMGLEPTEEPEQTEDHP